LVSIFIYTVGCMEYLGLWICVCEETSNMLVLKFSMRPYNRIIKPHEWLIQSKILHESKLADWYWYKYQSDDLMNAIFKIVLIAHVIIFIIHFLILWITHFKLSSILIFLMCFKRFRFYHILFTFPSLNFKLGDVHWICIKIPVTIYFLIICDVILTVTQF
jgi:hypothetical protein